MTKWLAYILVLIIFAPFLSSAKIKSNHLSLISNTLAISLPVYKVEPDTSTTHSSKKQEQEYKKKIKEVAKARKQPKPEKIEPASNTEGTVKVKPKRQRRPEGMERPPEIPRRNGN